MNNTDLDIFNKGNFQNINKDFILDTLQIGYEMSKIQEKYNKTDIDTLLNEFHDSFTGIQLGYELVNIDKHGFDCKKSLYKDIFLEVKTASISSKAITATFNDTTYEKAKAFMDKKLFLALGVWKNMSELLFVCYGQNKKIGEYLNYKIDEFQQRKMVRSTQTISLNQLVFKYGFDIYTKYDKYYISSLLITKSKQFIELDLKRIKDFKELSV
ncbi:hypothetical protein [Campylobacter sp. RM12637]|uniref:hypothetical protein n=1 Tax=Campylobacter sp. RM12637 TaxID=2735734 RepID=UPI0030144828|nr:hypothetical protein [Campylobacter sp. RM12637]